MRPGSPPLPAVADASNRLMLRDGTVATLRPATPDDRAAVRRFFNDLSPESRHRRFLSLADVSEKLVEQLCAACDPTVGVTLIAWRQVEHDSRPIAVASYTALGSSNTAEVAFAVDDRFHGRGLGTSMLERLAGIAASHGFRWFQAVTSVDNDPMLEVFRDSGFELRSRSARHARELCAWTDVLFMRTLNMQNARRRLAKHVCPFPLDIPRRLIVRYTNPGDLVLDPFNGLGTVPYVALQEGRRALGVELNADYYRISTQYLAELEMTVHAPTLFDIGGFGAELDDVVRAVAPVDLAAGEEAPLGVHGRHDLAGGAEEPVPGARRSARLRRHDSKPHQRAQGGPVIDQ